MKAVNNGTLVRISLAGEDQRWYGYLPGFAKDNFIFRSESDVQNWYPVNSGVNGSGFIYIADGKDGGYITYISDKSVNGLSGYRILSAVSQGSRDSGRAVDFIDSSPESIVSAVCGDGLSKDDRRQRLKEVVDKGWLESKPTKIIANNISQKRGEIIAVVVDLLLEAIKSGKRAGVAIVDICNYDLSEMQTLLRRALSCIPYKMANRLSFNTNANNIVGDVDIFCTNYSLKEYKGAVLVDVTYGLIGIDGNAKGDYKFKNDYAQRISKNRSKLLNGRNDMDNIDALNDSVAYDLLRLLIRNGLPITDEKIREARGYFEKCGGRSEEEMAPVLKEFRDAAHKVFFTEIFYKLSCDEERQFLRGYLTDECDKGLTADNVRVVAEAATTEKEANEYLGFLCSLWKQGEATSAAGAVTLFLCGQLDGYSKRIQKAISSRVNVLNKKDAGRYIAQCLQLQCPQGEGALQNFTLNYIKSFIATKFGRRNGDLPLFDAKVRFLTAQKTYSVPLLKGGLVESDDISYADAFYKLRDFGADDVVRELFGKWLQKNFYNDGGIQLLDNFGVEGSMDITESVIIRDYFMRDGTAVTLKTLSRIARALDYNDGAFERKCREIEGDVRKGLYQKILQERQMIESKKIAANSEWGETVPIQTENAEVKARSEEVDGIKESLNAYVAQLVEQLPVNAAKWERKRKKWIALCNKDRKNSDKAAPHGSGRTIFWGALALLVIYAVVGCGIAMMFTNMIFRVVNVNTINEHFDFLLLARALPLMLVFVWLVVTIKYGKDMYSKKKKLKSSDLMLRLLGNGIIWGLAIVCVWAVVVMIMLVA